MYFLDSLPHNKIVAAVIFTSVLAAPVVALAAPAIVTANVNVRAGPGSNYGRFALLPAGIGVDAGPCRGSWCQIRSSGIRGWVSARFLSFARYVPGPNYPGSRSTTVIIDGGVEDEWGPGWYPRWVPRWHPHRRPPVRPGYDPYQPDPVPGYDPYRDPGSSPVPPIAPPIGQGVSPMRPSYLKRPDQFGGGHLPNTRPPNSGR